MKTFDLGNVAESIPVSGRSRRSMMREGGRILYTTIGKRIFDLVLAVLLLLLLIPVITILWALTRRDGGLGIFGHRRIGWNVKSFRFWKIRSMVCDAEARLKKCLAENPEAAEEWRRDQKLTNDPRITRYGPDRTTYLSVLPGLTCLWLVSGRNDVTYAERVEMGIQYLQVASVKKDLALLLKTEQAVIGMTRR